ncbi:dynein light chain type 1 domain-containing protein [Ditylenchus destructor]|nr:dynein light chain type 1 domain-containing protein [Ditylenchus destructor]
MQEFDTSDKIEVKESDMNAEMTKASVEIVREGLRRFNQDKDVASYLKDAFEHKFGPTWHTVVGKSFGSRVSYEMNHFILLKVNQHTVLIFKCGGY